QGRIWIDPASEHVAVPQTPASVKGGIAWIAGDLPMQVGARGPNDGRVSITGEITLAADGSAAFRVELSADGIAEELLRARFATLPPAGRERALKELVGVAH